ncbi:hypothetical protein RKK46_002224 [Listeria innocua]|nr:hypothetical protein [Listeria innocua]HCW3194954.1 hypothetical protein [Listeria monocytogenes]EIX7081066.1 hypothetical protein [Listeria innocua]EIX7081925.1 hypothetical protein [Listeria innocua]EIX7084983.1 hypothetical protein [Listeria innocua]
MKPLYDKIQLDMNKKHVIELTTAELIRIIAAYGESNNASMEAHLSDTDVFTRSFHWVKTPNLYNDLLEYGYLENIIREEFLL